MTELERVRELGRAALTTLEANRRRIDDLNVYPVPDGDTGTNMTLTARAIMEALDSSAAADRPALAKELTRAALMGARGNSGVIFSQILRGAAEALGEAGLLDSDTIGAPSGARATPPTALCAAPSRGRCCPSSGSWRRRRRTRGTRSSSRRNC